VPAPIDPTFSVTGGEWAIAPVQRPSAPTDAAAGGEGGFAGALGKAVQALQADQTAATEAVQGMVAGTTEDPTKAVMALERARLSMQLAGQIRTKGVEALQDIFHTQV
jgi:flagellar hook-basal body complex protein FliE